MAGIELTEQFERRVFVVEVFDEHVLQLAGLRGGGEQRADPAVIGGKAAAGGLGGAMEDPELIGGGEIGDDLFVFRNAEAGVTAMRGIDEQLEEFPAERLV